MKYLLIIIVILCTKNLLSQNIGVSAKYCDTAMYINDLLSSREGSIYAACGNFNYATSQGEACILKLDNNYNIIWQKLMGGSQFDKFQKIRQISVNRLLLVGTTLSSDGDLSPYGYTQPTTGNIWVVIVDTFGNTIYGSEYGYGSTTTVTDVVVSQGGNIYIIGNTVAEYGDFLTMLVQDLVTIPLLSEPTQCSIKSG
ncbi:MAG: hypothetical protein IPN14_10525 [Bacteroidetes bacterium]|nr:hypothetical protein [Bacteroidota bacterium]